MQWRIRSERQLYRDPWLTIGLADVELPDGRHLDHRLIRMGPSAGAVVLNDDETHVMLLWRHRFITDSWGWEIPIGAIDDGESPVDAAAREVEEEAGWRPGPLTPLVTLHPSGGILDSTHYLFRATGATHIGPPKDAFESDRIDWVATRDLVQLIDKGQIDAGSTLVGLLYLLATRGQQTIPPAERS